MFIDLTLPIDLKSKEMAENNEKIVSYGHLGTHFDIMDKTFPLELIERNGIVFDISLIRERDVETTDLDLNLVKEGMFVAFYSGFINEETYGTKPYFQNHPELSPTLINALLEKKISIIGIDFSGVRRGKEHTPMDQHCADHNVFIIENLCNLDQVLAQKSAPYFKANTYPLNYQGLSGIPCRVVAKI